jgi:NADH dehydrogenase FAD-containing subunit
MSRKKVLVLGGNFGGLTAALAVSHELRGDVDIRVVSASDRFLFNPSLIWLPFGKRRPADITFPLGSGARPRRASAGVLIGSSRRSRQVRRSPGGLRGPGAAQQTSDPPK